MLVVPFLMVTTVVRTGTLDAINLANVVNAVISDDDFKLSSVNEKGITDVVAVTTALVAVDHVTQVEDTTVFAKDARHYLIEQGYLRLFWTGNL